MGRDALLIVSALSQLGIVMEGASPRMMFAILFVGMALKPFLNNVTIAIS